MVEAAFSIFSSESWQGMVQVKLVLDFVFVYHFYQFRFIYLDFQIAHFIFNRLSNWLRRSHPGMFLPWLPQVSTFRLRFNFWTFTYLEFNFLTFVGRIFQILVWIWASTVPTILRFIRRFAFEKL